MTTYMLSLTGDEQEAANATHWARFRKARMLARSRDRRDGAPAAVSGRESVVIVAHGAAAAAPRPAAAPGALAALLVGTLDIQDGMKIVVADGGGEAFAQDLATEIALLGRQVCCIGKMTDLAFGLAV